MRTLIELVQPTLFRLRGQSRLRYFREACQTMVADREALHQLQLRRLRALVTHASESVPYYKELFQKIGFHAQDLKDLADFSKLPILTREDVVANVERLVSRKFDKSALVYSSTGGSTGTPMNYYQTKDYLEKAEGMWMRSLLWIGKRPTDTLLKFVGTAPGFDRGWFGPTKRAARLIAERMVFLNAFDISPQEMARAVKLIRRLKPSFYYGYASSISFLARHVKDVGATLPPVKAVITSAEKLYSAQKSLIEEVFQAPVYSFYGSREVRQIASTCRRGNMHQIADFVYTEFEPLVSMPGQTSIVVTPLDSYAMPLIRYANGDVGHKKEGSCECGNCFPIMNVDIGRTTDMFLTPDGRWVHGEYFTHLMYGVEGVSAFQFHQKEPNKIILRIVKSEVFGPESQQFIDRSLQKIKSDISPAYELELEFVDEIPLSPVGKFLFTKSDLSPNSRAAASRAGSA